MGIIMESKIIGPVIESIGSKIVMVAAIHQQEKTPECHEHDIESQLPVAVLNITQSEHAVL
jgi:hypothetical protein